ncbi:hypothetical protein NitaMp107 (mitochondrion) [Nicotiana tabacum]|uniref:Uncharacterized protein n=1 Tax=Nicotiana tabacum TaxID=4097 RepID=Q5M9W8_TOBAC|nr:hypothetical protein NitaMp107 [Nicotiana tabacum]UYX57521.1 hypothetical protein [Nicotiana tabacum]BAD83510.1 hypothetical protein [Nicotiana tabacum]
MRKQAKLRKSPTGLLLQNELYLEEADDENFESSEKSSRHTFTIVLSTSKSMFGSGKSSLGTCLIEISKIDAYANTSIPLGHGDDVRNPIRIIYCLNEISIIVTRQLKRG